MEAGGKNFKEECLMIINHNLMAMNTHRQLGINNTATSKSMEKLSSGFRINRAGDDAAGLAISEKMRGQIRGLKQAMRNAQDGISLIQTAEGALSETHAILQRMRELAVQAATDTNTMTDRKELQKEINQLLDEIDRIGNNTEFNTQKLLDGTYSAKKIHIGANEGQNMDITIGDMRTGVLGGSGSATHATASLSGVTFTAVDAGSGGNEIQVHFVDSGSGKSLTVEVTGKTITVTLATDTNGNITSTVSDIVSAINEDSGASALVTASGSGATTVSEGNVTLAGGKDAGTSSGSISSLRVDDVDNATTGGVLTQSGANAAITIINRAIEQVSAERSKLGAIQNRLEHTIANLGTSAENLQAAESRIRDLDMAEEIMAFTKNSILQQAATAMLAQANQQPQTVLQLLR